MVGTFEYLSVPSNLAARFVAHDLDLWVYGLGRDGGRSVVRHGGERARRRNAGEGMAEKNRGAGSIGRMPDRSRRA